MAQAGREAAERKEAEQQRAVAKREAEAEEVRTAINSGTITATFLLCIAVMSIVLAIGVAGVDRIQL